MKIVIGVSGKLGSGKNYIINNVIIPVLKNYINIRYLEIAFADQIKINVMTKNNINFSDVYESKTKESRQLLQNEGTEVGRNTNKDIWVNYLSNWINVNNSRGISIFIISDCRFLNEVEYVHNQNGIMIKVLALNRNNKQLIKESEGNIEIYDKIKSHRSECDLDNLNDSNFNLIIDNDLDKILNIRDLQNQFEGYILQKFSEI